MPGKRKLQLPSDRPVPAGVPLGGIGTGCIELGIDGRMRNVTINNNRWAENRIPVVPGSFAAVRALVRGKVSTRILQSSSSIPWEDAGITPQFCTQEQLGWRGLYPIAAYTLRDDSFPLFVRWQGMGLIVPYELDASTVPAILLQFTVENPTDKYVDASILFNWENICGCTKDEWPGDRGNVVPIFQMGSGDEEARRISGIQFGMESGIARNEEGAYCLVPRVNDGSRWSFAKWNGNNAGDTEEFWNRFVYDADLQDMFDTGDAQHLGAACATHNIPPKNKHTFHIALSWYCPQFTIGDTDFGNAYTNFVSSANEAAGRALRHTAYYTNAISKWHQRLTSSSLPKWFPRMLLNSMHVMSTNTIYTREKKCAMMETPATPVLSTGDRRLYGSIGTLLFFPDFELHEFDALLSMQRPTMRGGLDRHAGFKSLGAVTPSGIQPQADLGASLILVAYRNYAMTGRMVSLQQDYPKLKSIAHYIESNFVEENGLISLSDGRTTFEDWPIEGSDSYTNSLWIAAIRTYSILADRMGEETESAWANDLFSRAQTSFSESLWHGTGYYRHYKSPNAVHDGCNAAQLAGVWQSDFLMLGGLFPPDKVAKALDTIRHGNISKHLYARGVMPDRRPWPVPEGSPTYNTGTSWPLLTLAATSALQVTRGKVDRGLYECMKLQEHVLVNGERTFNQPLQWDIGGRIASGFGSDRHFSATSVWHMYFALLGFFPDAANQTFWLTPNLPLNVDEVNAPLFTPLGAGSLMYRVHPGPPYSQQMRLVFESPVTVNRFVVRVPNAIQSVNVQVLNNGDPMGSDHYIGSDGFRKLVEIVPQYPVTIQQPVDLLIQGN